MTENSGENQATRDELGRFMPGASGNPAGKPKGTRHLTSLVEEALKKIANDEGTSYEQQLIQKILDKAIKDGNEQMIKLMWNYIDGMPQQHVDHTTDGQPLPILANVQFNDSNKEDREPQEENKSGTGRDISVEDHIDSLVAD